MEKCFNCDIENNNLRKCLRCFQVRYCNQDCQHAHWRKEHEKSCMKPFKTVPIINKDLGLVATRVIKKGETIIREKPVFRTHESLAQQFKQLRSEQQHELLCLYHSPHLLDGILYRNHTKEDQEKVREMIEKCSENEDPLLTDIFNSNAITNAPDVGGRSSLYLLLSRINHSCNPNVVWSYTRADPNIREVRALRDIDVGEELEVGYSDKSLILYQTSDERRETLKQHWNFLCICSLCKDPEVNDKKRRELKSLNNLAEKLVSQGKYHEGLEVAEKILKEESNLPEFSSVTPNTMMAVYRLSLEAQSCGVRVPDHSDLVDDSIKLARALGDSFEMRVEHQIEECQSLILMMNLSIK